MNEADTLNQRCQGLYPDLLGIAMKQINREEVFAEMQVTEAHLAPNGFLHAGSIVSLADTACGNGVLANLPEGANGFTTVELKSNHLGTVREGKVCCHAQAVHQGRTTQVWDATITCASSGKKLALFRCTQMILYPRPSV